jgi:hypothetical protein
MLGATSSEEDLAYHVSGPSGPLHCKAAIGIVPSGEQRLALA